MYDLASRPTAGLSTSLLSRRLQVRFLSGAPLKSTGYSSQRSMVSLGPEFPPELAASRSVALMLIL